MTPEDRPPRKRGRRRRRRGTGAGPETGNGNPQMTNPDSIGNTVDPYRDRSGSGPGAQRRRRRRQRHRSGREPGSSPLPPEAPIPVDIAPGELTAVSGVLYIKPNGGGLLVQTVNNYVPFPGDAIVPRSIIERLHLDPGLLLAGNARRGGNGMLEFIQLETVEGMPLEEFRD